jgi:hypothetical protein
VPGIIGKQSASQGGNTVCQGGKQKRPVGDALGTGDVHLQGLAGDFWFVCGFGSFFQKPTAV